MRVGGRAWETFGWLLCKCLLWAGFECFVAIARARARLARVQFRWWWCPSTARNDAKLGWLGCLMSPYRASQATVDASSCGSNEATRPRFDVRKYKGNSPFVIKMCTMYHDLHVPAKHCARDIMAHPLPHSSTPAVTSPKAQAGAQLFPTMRYVPRYSSRMSTARRQRIFDLTSSYQNPSTEILPTAVQHGDLRVSCHGFGCDTCSDLTQLWRGKHPAHGNRHSPSNQLMTQASLGSSPRAQRPPTRLNMRSCSRMNCWP